MGVLEQAAQRQAKGQTFALATVVRTVSVTAAKAAKGEQQQAGEARHRGRLLGGYSAGRSSECIIPGRE